VLEVEDCSLPTAERIRDGLGINREYVDMRGLTWGDVADYLACESEALPLLRGRTNAGAIFKDYLAHKYADEAFVVNEDIDEDDIDMNLLVDDWLSTLDPGVGSTVAALYALKCVPFYSCNGGAFGDVHHAEKPMVVFYANPKRRSLLNAAADAAGVFVGRSDGGCGIVDTDEIEGLPRFAAALMKLRRSVPVDASFDAGRPVNDPQMQLEL
jgi:hypothetical protein